MSNRAGSLKISFSGDNPELRRICPDFVIELRSPSDILNEIQFKLDEYGAKLGFRFIRCNGTSTFIDTATSGSVWTILNPRRVIPNSKASPWT